MFVAQIILAALALLSLGLGLWQYVVARRFPLHSRNANPAFAPGVTLLKPLKGCDAETPACLRSWLTQAYPGPVQILFGVADTNDPVCAIVEKLLREFPAVDARLVICPEKLGANAKVTTLIQLERLAKHDLLVISDADVFVPGELLSNALAPFAQPLTGLVNCFYQLATPANLAMRWEAVAVNADFWSQVLQARSLKPLDFALGAVMAVRRNLLTQAGGFAGLADCLADDYQLGHRVAKQGGRIELCPVVVECRESPRPWQAIWAHQLRWARTIRVCQSVPYFFSILSNATLWPLLLILTLPALSFWGLAWLCLVVRMLTGLDLQQRLTRKPNQLSDAGLFLMKDLLHAAIWALSFTGSQVEWRGQRFQVGKGGQLRPLGGS